MSDRIFKSDEARGRLERWYDRFLLKLTVPVEHREVPTAIGPSHVLLAGDKRHPPLVCLHGSLASSAHLLSEIGSLSERFRLIAPDLPGQSVKGPQVRMPYHDGSLAAWLLEVLGGLGVVDFDLLGVSWGGFVARKMAFAAPDRVRKLVLLVPAGIVSGPVWKGITRLMIPLVLYRLFPSERRLRRFYEPLFTTRDDDWAGYLGDAFRDFVLDLRIPPLATDDELRGLSMPTLVIGGEDDLSFPGEKLIRRVKAHVPRVEVELLPACKHSPPTTPAFRTWLADRVATFLTAGEEPETRAEPRAGVGP